MKNIVHIIPHAHWDREWYMPLEIHRARLVNHLDNVLDLLEKDPSYTYHLDGQMIAVEDYLMFRPESEKQIQKFVREGRLHIGPWYVLQDEFLTSGEANVRNLLFGIHMAERFGEVCRIGYLPDAFGNVGQMPQLFVQSGMKAAAFGRGVTLRPENPDPAEHFPQFSEFSWQSPDGSSIPAIFFAGWYNNGQEIPVDPAEARAYWDERLAYVRKYASSRHLLFLNGGDHQPVQKDLAAAMETARKLYPDIEFICSDFEFYTKCADQDRNFSPETVVGELAGQESDGWNTLCNTASSHNPIKKLNRCNETLLSQTAEPLLSMATLAGMKFDSALLHRAWKLLIENHPHDSICSCGIDQVNREVITRFEKSMQLGDYLAEEAGNFLAEKIKAPGLEDAEASFAVFNTSGWTRSQVITVTLGVDREYGTRVVYPSVKNKKIKTYRLYTYEGEEIPAEFGYKDARFGYELPDDSFRKPYFERGIKVTFSAENIPPYGYAVYYLKESSQPSPEAAIYTQNSHMENRFIAVDISADGTFDITDKATGRVYHGLGVFEDTGDVGNEYNFRETRGQVIRSGKTKAEIALLSHSENRTAVKIRQMLHLPLSAGSDLAQAHESMTRWKERNIGRSSKTADFPVTTYLSMEDDSPLLHIRVNFDNTAKDHRLRILFPTDILTDTHFADSVFDVIERPDIPGKNWTNPSRCQRMQYFAAAEDSVGGLAVINRGFYEYEILPERKQIAVTLMRAVGEMGDWGVFPTPDAQDPGPFEAELSVLVYAGNSFRENGCREAVQFQNDLSVFQIRNSSGSLPERGNLLNCSGTGLSFSALKPSEDGKGLILRAVNVTGTSTMLNMIPPAGCVCYESSIIEQKGKPIEADKTGQIHVPVGKKEIKTIRIEMY